MDDSSIFDINQVMSEYSFPEVRVFHTDVTPEQRGSENRLSININRALNTATGDLVCFLADDDLYFPTWFGAAVHWFSTPFNRQYGAAYGRLIYTHDMHYSLPGGGHGIWPGHMVDKPLGALDHNQVMHRNFRPPFRWPETLAAIGAPDGVYFTEIVRGGWCFYPINALAVVKRLHGKSIHTSWGSEISQGQAENARE